VAALSGPVDRLHVVTGAPGTGKSTLIAALAEAGVATCDEVGRRILREQVAIGGQALPWADAGAFGALMLDADIAAHAEALARDCPVVLDRGLPDIPAFFAVSGLAIPPAAEAAARDLRYNTRIFLAPFWPAIFVSDAERPLPIEHYRASEPVVVAAYRRHGYSPIELPRASVADRVQFVIERL
jgi:predicted ATPase